MDDIKVRETIMDIHVARASSTSVKLATLSLVIVCTGLLLAPERSQAEEANRTICLAGTHTANWSPGVTNTAKDVNVSTTSKWGPCASHPQLKGVSASSSAHFKANFSCKSLLLQTNPIVWDIKWSDGAASTYKFIAILNNIGNLSTTILGVGTIMDGRYKGASAVSTFVLSSDSSSPNNDCNKWSGVTQVSGLSTLVIAP
ncbi:Uncharacterized protein ALO81_03965 [Pseudomonas cannabina]|uniref:Uncharacterized protein n=2 Tax=Pseudomonas cannabina TaxID=86840 RepID=A0A0P9LG53_PSECA|nr:Uncharacterized protein ALO81_03965 [Pseudomonas cannabina]